jgi:Ser/Thr protein kinase RdoA (MazF antagonist)
VPQVREWSAYIAGTVPDTIQHDDLHDGQVFVKDGRYRILDWGDACVSHPFYSLTVTLRSIAHTFKLKPDAPELKRLTDLYLEPFTATAPKNELRENYEIARKLGRICRALTWATVVVNLPPAQRKEERGAVPGWLALFLEAASN